MGADRHYEAQAAALNHVCDAPRLLKELVIAQATIDAITLQLATANKHIEDLQDELFNLGCELNEANSR